ncbi:hypothetical protein BDR07DRAFT_610511 [Suillus spraguei]|nr:hypothetical protein BDR07DRAFT_610511 [Suillus spraguei]
MKLVIVNLHVRFQNEAENNDPMHAAMALLMVTNLSKVDAIFEDAKQSKPDFVARKRDWARSTLRMSDTRRSEFIIGWCSRRPQSTRHVIFKLTTWRVTQIEVQSRVYQCVDDSHVSLRHRDAYNALTAWKMPHHFPFPRNAHMMTVFNHFNFMSQH